MYYCEICCTVCGLVMPILVLALIQTSVSRCCKCNKYNILLLTVHSVIERSALSQMHKNTFELRHAEVLLRSQVDTCTRSCFTDWQVAQLLIFNPFAGSTNNPVMDRELSLKQEPWMSGCKPLLLLAAQIQTVCDYWLWNPVSYKSVYWTWEKPTVTQGGNVFVWNQIQWGGGLRCQHLNGNVSV